MKRRFCLTLVCLLLALPAGCVERTETMTLNPDGAGKDQIDLRFDPRMFVGQVEKRDAVKNILASAQGVEAWENVSYEAEHDGKVRFKATAYFRDVNNYHFNLAGDLQTIFTKNHDGTMTLTATSNYIPRFQNPRNQPPMTDAQIDQNLRASRANWQRQKQGMAPNYGALKINLTYVLPGKTDKASVFHPVPGGVELNIDGGKVLDGVGKLMDDDQTARSALIDARNAGSSLENELMKRVVFGNEDKIAVTLGGDLKPLFDYAAASAEARHDEPMMFVKLGLPGENTTNPPPLDHPLVAEPVR